MASAGGAAALFEKIENGVLGSIFTTSEDLDDAKKKSSVEELQDLFKCIICLGRVDQAQMCPHCSKMCCLDCIQRWLDESQSLCPHCRTHLQMSHLVNCRFANEVTAELDRMQQAAKQSEVEMCLDHKTPLHYYCKTCSVFICPDCALLSDKHRGHEFEPLQSVYDRHLLLIRTEADVVKTRLKDIHALMNAVDCNIESVTRGKEERATELKLAVEQMQQRLEAQMRGKLLTLIAQKNAMSDEVAVLEQVIIDLNRELSGVPKSVLVAKTDHILHMLQQVLRRPTTQYAKMSVPADFTSEIVPKFDGGIFLLKNYPEARCGPSGVLYSDPLHASGLTWRLKVYPNGNGVACGTYLSIFLEMLKGPPHPSKYEYRVEMVSCQNPQQCVVREFASDFQVGECWGYNRFFRIDLLEKEGYISQDGSILLRFYVRAPTCFQQCRDQKQYIETLKADRVEQQQQVCKLKQEVKRLRNRLVRLSCRPRSSTSSSTPVVVASLAPGADMDSIAASESSSMLPKKHVSDGEVSISECERKEIKCADVSGDHIYSEEETVTLTAVNSCRAPGTRSDPHIRASNEGGYCIKEEKRSRDDSATPHGSPHREGTSSRCLLEECDSSSAKHRTNPRAKKATASVDNVEASDALSSASRSPSQLCMSDVGSEVEFLPLCDVWEKSFDDAVPTPTCNQEERQIVVVGNQTNGINETSDISHETMGENENDTRAEDVIFAADVESGANATCQAFSVGGPVGSRTRGVKAHRHVAFNGRGSLGSDGRSDAGDSETSASIASAAIEENDDNNRGIKSDNSMNASIDGSGSSEGSSEEIREGRLLSNENGGVEHNCFLQTHATMLSDEASNRRWEAIAEAAGGDPLSADSFLSCFDFSGQSSFSACTPTMSRRTGISGVAAPKASPMSHGTANMLSLSPRRETQQQFSHGVTRDSDQQSHPREASCRTRDATSRSSKLMTTLLEGSHTSRPGQGQGQGGFGSHESSTCDASTADNSSVSEDNGFSADFAASFPSTSSRARTRNTTLDLFRGTSGGLNEVGVSAAQRRESMQIQGSSMSRCPERNGSRNESWGGSRSMDLDWESVLDSSDWKATLRSILTLSDQADANDLLAYYAQFSCSDDENDQPHLDVHPFSNRFSGASDVSVSQPEAEAAIAGSRSDGFTDSGDQESDLNVKWSATPRARRHACQDRDRDRERNKRRDRQNSVSDFVSHASSCRLPAPAMTNDEVAWGRVPLLQQRHHGPWEQRATTSTSCRDDPSGQSSCVAPVNNSPYAMSATHQNEHADPVCYSLHGNNISRPSPGSYETGISSSDRSGSSSLNASPSPNRSSSLAARARRVRLYAENSVIRSPTRRAARIAKLQRDLTFGASSSPPSASTSTNASFPNSPEGVQRSHAQARLVRATPDSVPPDNQMLSPRNQLSPVNTHSAKSEHPATSQSPRMDSGFESLETPGATRRSGDMSRGFGGATVLPTLQPHAQSNSSDPTNDVDSFTGTDELMLLLSSLRAHEMESN